MCLLITTNNKNIVNSKKYSRRFILLHNECGCVIQSLKKKN